MSYPNKFKQGFIDRVEKKLRDCEIIYNPKTKGIWFINREERYWYLEYKIETNYLWWRYDFFNQLKELFCMPNEVFDEIISKWVENKLNCEVLTTDYSIDGEAYSVKDILNCKVNTTIATGGTAGLAVEETLNFKVDTTESEWHELGILVEDTLNFKVVSTKSLIGTMKIKVEETLNCKVNRVDWGLSQHLNIEDTLNINNNIK